MKGGMLILLSSCLTTVCMILLYPTVLSSTQETPYLPNLRDMRVIKQAELYLHQLAEQGEKERLVMIVSTTKTHLERIQDPKSQYILYMIGNLIETIYLPQAIDNFVALSPDQIREYNLTNQLTVTHEGENTDTTETTTTSTTEQEEQPIIPDTVFLGFQETGIASRYGQAWNGRTTAGGEIFDSAKFTAAAPTRYPFGTRVKVTNPKTGQWVVVRITDRGDFEKLGRVIDLSAAAFKAINNDSVRAGLLEVILEVVEE